MSGFSSHTGPILDYSSPRPQGRVRLPSRSRIEMRTERDGVVISEWLQAKGSVIAVMAIAVFSLVLLGVTASGAFTRRMHMEDRIILGTVPVAVGIVEVIVLLMVINNTWRRTTLEARRDSLLLTFTAPFGMERYEWGASQVEEFRVEATTTLEHRNSLGELEIHLAGLPLVKLFTDHPAAELQSMAVRLRQEVGLGVTGARVPGNGDIA